MKHFKFIKKSLVFGLLTAIILVIAFFTYPSRQIMEKNTPKKYSGILRLWNIDGIEGGIGSRSSFLSRISKSFEKQNEGLFILISSHTPESAAMAIEKGELPSLISFSGNCAFAVDSAKPINGFSWSGAEIEDKTLAFPWCKGGYFLFTAEGDFSDISPENTILSEAKNTSVYAAAYFESLRGTYHSESAERAYLSFMNGSYKYMIGTQRDVYRLITKNFEFKTKPMQGYSDLWQFISICAEGEMQVAAKAYVQFLLSENIQRRLPEIGMMSELYSVYNEEVEPMFEAQKIYPKQKLSVFLSSKVRENFYLEAKQALEGNENSAKKIKKYLV